MATGVGDALGVESVRRVATDYAELVRLPNVFTAPPDVIAGVALAVALGATVSVPTIVGLCLASALIYAAGTTLNDVADVDEDAKERPDRPIPSGRVGRSEALSVGIILLVGGVVVATVVGGLGPGLTAVALALAVALYDGLLKGTPAGFFAMGSARGLNVALGLSIAGVAAFDGLALLFPASVVVYVAALTRMAEAETGGGGDGSAVALTGAGATLAAMVVAVVVTVRGTPTAGLAATLVAAGFLAWDWRALGPAIADPVPSNVGPAVGTCVLGIVLLDAAVAVIAGPTFVLAAAAFAIPATTLSRYFDVN
ncbi:4-hydroxybenzoate polyprenyltransferase [Halogeometricum borinquense DSM 11551]|uniref:4-hydroxybenzoate polyprenyltransferase n=1 Tax=Halogeometricum borinquense (strain ATCC 700274 / DSM 11551 / JCM 10706 / KCTC 4070 / PR3) TaxID=469382 RepID=E4NLM7_HALBP|nr:UbiA family prenyltransferase [Halogeometricum borinquense]ADQ67230.1 4-hydroxybenzoate polyprenyltransferase-like prenyltransferase [Halogeometricum borinquense DSM 11551]ELY29564.1 4-hydroxybenzoate polyprenyltransferase [Halogeometricum borinquense DSM 11551]